MNSQINSARFRHKKFSSGRASYISLTILLGALLVIALTNRAGYVFSGVVFNPDEAEFLATGKLASQDLMPYRSYTTSTYGPALPMLLGLMGKAGIPLTLPWAHLLSFVLLLAILALPVRVAIESANHIYALGIVVPIALVTISGINSLETAQSAKVDYLALNSELLPIFFLSLIFVLLRWKDKINFFELLIGLLGFLIFIAKLQLVPMFVLATFWLHIVNCEDQSKKIKISKIYTSFIAFAVLFFGLLGKVGVLKNYLDESLLAAMNYVDVNNQSSNFSSRIFETFQLLINEPMIIFATASLFALLIICRCKDRLLIRKILYSLLVPFMCIALPGTNFGHYKWIFLWTLLYLPILLIKHINESGLSKDIGLLQSWGEMEPHKRLLLFIPTFLLAIPMVSEYRAPNDLSISQFTQQSVIPEEENTAKSEFQNTEKYVSEVSVICPEGSAVFIWGWASDLYSYYGWTPIPRLVNDSVRILVRNPGSEWVTSNILEIVRDKKAVCIIDATNDAFFGNNNRKAISKNKKISKDLKKNYVRVNVEEFGGVIYIPRTQ